MKIRLASDLQIDSIVDGEGIRTVIWTQGCSHKCLGCHNESTWDFKGGFLVDVEEIKTDLKNLKGQDGITLSGGDPMYQIDACLEIAKYAKEIGLSVWCYTGFTYEELLKMSNSNPNILKFLSNIDVLVDGKFMMELRSLDLKFKGSSNQRIIDVTSSLKKGEIVLVDKYIDKKIYNKKTEFSVYI